MATLVALVLPFPATAQESDRCRRLHAEIALIDQGPHYPQDLNDATRSAVQSLERKLQPRRAEQREHLIQAVKDFRCPTESPDPQKPETRLPLPGYFPKPEPPRPAN